MKDKKQPRKPRRVVPAVVALGLGAIGVLTLAAPASATPVDITCLTGTRNTAYTPPLTYTPQPTNLYITDNFSCTSLLSGVSSGSGSFSAYAPSTSCLASVQSPLTSITTTYHWNTGTSSTIVFASSTAVRAADGTVTVTSIGAVTAGLGAGQTATRVTVEPNLDLTACLDGGLSETNSVVNSLVIAPV
ncbi:hypothetical protein ACFY8O_33805 [Streptomyces argenteolus]|uniref:Ig-like domain-containing protein n=1 Tax=Streptomyces argenteolus TaxID=67274 RepID=A0ABW6XGI5_9ACTN